MRLTIRNCVQFSIESYALSWTESLRSSILSCPSVLTGTLTLTVTLTFLLSETITQDLEHNAWHPSLIMMFLAFFENVVQTVSSDEKHLTASGPGDRDDDQSLGIK